MSFPVILLAAFSLATDAFAVSVTNGACFCGKRGPLPTAMRCGIAFGAFQSAMTLIGYFAGNLFEGMIKNTGLIAFILLAVIGLRMINDGLKERKPAGEGAFAAPARLTTLALIAQALATSIDALAIGVGLGVMRINLMLTVLSIGIVTFACCFGGVYIGRFLGAGLKDKAQIFGGVVLILIGLNILFR